MPHSRAPVGTTLTGAPGVEPPMMTAIWLFPALAALSVATVIVLFRRAATETHPQMVKTTYRTCDGAADYGFSIERSGGEYRIYITRQPAYGRRDTSLHATHRLCDGRRYYVCWTRPIRSVEDAKAVARAWAESTQRYVRSGQRF